MKLTQLTILIDRTAYFQYMVKEVHCVEKAKQNEKKIPKKIRS